MSLSLRRNRRLLSVDFHMHFLTRDLRTFALSIQKIAKFSKSFEIRMRSSALIVLCLSTQSSLARLNCVLSRRVVYITRVSVVRRSPIVGSINRAEKNTPNCQASTWSPAQPNRHFFQVPPRTHALTHAYKLQRYLNSGGETNNI